MAVQNSLAKRQGKPTFSAYLTSDAVKNKINQIVGGKDGARFITAVVSAVSVNPALADCDHASILSCALLGEALKLSPSPQLGHYYMVPYKDNKRGITVAQFQLGYKGYIQLAIRSGYYKKINVLSIKEGELIKFDPLNEEIEVVLYEDEEVRESKLSTGYYAMFEYHNGFRKVLYWSRKKMEAHASQYSKGYAEDKKRGTSWTFWSKDFDGMAYKTMLRQLISKWGIMSIEMQSAMEKDMGVVADDGSVQYVDNQDVIEAPPAAADAPEAPASENVESSFFGEGGMTNAQ
ncbi:recombinase RecT [Papillibacter cinnamivorans]|uniref:Recombination protein RecT n=1 Tax=Papillibacter cinnamivorans DSM 12816 TaxID=1122930 RepID=A0A1W1YQ81_9FIRM|nr:recombinase RecT [Papillibacter cinnamivorans]SMC38282.1 recombination protein RecT [Papillibacter cinnamivorans DSM 12816]